MRQVVSAGHEAVIGLEIHVQLNTKTKMFCGCKLAFGEPPNTLTCPVCLGHPGALPVPNEQAMFSALMIGHALGCEIPEQSVFYRKNYFYPDLPKGYQVSQCNEPICGAGRLGGVRIHQVHLEEDAAKLVHTGSSGRIDGAERSVVDFNRGGAPLVEIVTEPDIRSAAQAREFLQLLRATLKQLGVSDVNMDEGSLRCDANISVRAPGAALGVKTELKNMNSFRFLERGVEAEIARQVALVDAGEEVEQQTLHFDPSSGALTPLRSKEEAHDYRYFPEPDLVPIVPTQEMIKAARNAVPELPEQKQTRFQDELGLSADTARLLAFRGELGAYYEQALASAPGADAERLADWVGGELVARIGADADPAASKVAPAELASLVQMVGGKHVSGSAAKTVLDEMIRRGGDPQRIVHDKGLAAINDPAELEAVVVEAIGTNEDAVAQLRDGKDKAIGAIIGSVMKKTRNRADGADVERIIREQLGD